MRRNSNIFNKIWNLAVKVIFFVIDFSPNKCKVCRKRTWQGEKYCSHNCVWRFLTEENIKHE